MEQEHCMQIIEAIPQIMELFNYEYFKRKCLEHDIVFDVMVKNLEEMNTTDDTRFEALLRKLTLRGPGAYYKFIDVLLDASEKLLTLTQHHLTLLILSKIMLRQTKPLRNQYEKPHAK